VGKKILYIWDADYPWDIRVEKICKSLNKNGNEVHIAARNLKRLPEYERRDGLFIHRLRTWANEKVNYVLSFPAFFSPIWNAFLDKLIKQNAIDLIIVRDLPLAPAGIWVGKRNGIPVIFDMAENYVSMISEIWKTSKFKGLNFFVRNPYMARFVERYSFKNADHILVVVDEVIPVVLKNGGQLDKVTVVRNTPSLDVFKRPSIKMNEDLELIKNCFSAIYVGGIQMGRGIETVLEAIPEIVGNIPSFLFVVVGDGYCTQRLQEIIKQKGLTRHVLWIGWVDHEKTYDYMELCNIGLIPHLVTDQINTTVPNKLFDYMGLGLPVVATDALPLSRILNEEKCGKVFKSGDPKDLTRAVCEIYNSGSDYGQNGKKAVINRYNWKADEKKLFEALDKVV